MGVEVSWPASISGALRSAVTAVERSAPRTRSGRGSCSRWSRGTPDGSTSSADSVGRSSVAERQKMPLSDLFERWLDDLLDEPLPDEPLADCGDCPMLPPARASTVSFSPRTKCCTYEPLLYNFQLGGILQDPEALARDRMRDRVRSGEGLTPLGLGRSASARRKYREMRTQGRFGQAGGLRCPWYIDTNGGSCGIWRHRNATCATWFCKHERGEAGEGLWSAVLHLLSGLERAAAQSAMVALGATPSDFGEWTGREAAYLLACRQHVAAMHGPAVLASAGRDGAALAALVRRAQRAYRSQTPPAQVRFRGVRPVARERDRVYVATHNPYQVIALHRDLLRALPAFNRHPRTEVQAAYGISDALLLELVDFDVLEPR